MGSLASPTPQISTSSNHAFYGIVVDHLPTPSDGSIPEVKIPLICTTEYNFQPDGSTFMAFPKYCLVQIRQSSPDIGPDEALASLIQSWLYFGTLSEFLRVPLELKTFRRYDAGGFPILTTEKLDTLLRLWLDNGLRNPGHIVTRSKILGTVTIVARTLYCCEAFDKAHASTQLRSILFSIDILLETILAACRGVTTYDDDDLSSKPSLWNQHMSRKKIQQRYKTLEADSSFRRLFLSHMVSNRWCFHEIDRLLKTLGLLSMYYLACITRTRPHADHSRCTDSVKCIAHADAANSNKHIEVHTSEDCQCDVVELTPDQGALLKDCIQKGDIPLLRCTWSDSQPGIVDIEIIKRAWYHSYCAISHVWIDGLGNSSKNGVPLCQLRQLAHRVYLLNHRYDLRHWKSRFLYSVCRMSSPLIPSRRKSVTLWLDGYCIPVSDEMLTMKTVKRSIETKVKDAAIAQMNTIYFQAHKTLMIDYEVSGLSTDGQGLQQYASYKDCKNKDFPCQKCASGVCRIIMHIYCSIWMSRVWTRQEASFSGDLVLNVPNLASTHAGSYGFLSIRDFESLTRAKMYNLWKSPVPRDRLIARIVEPFCHDDRNMIRKIGREGRLPGAYPGLQDIFGQTLEQKLKGYDFIDTWNRLLHLSTTKIPDVASVMALFFNYGLSDIIGTKSRSTITAKPKDSQERIARRRFANIISDQDAIPLVLLCYVSDQSYVAMDGVPSWIPPAPSEVLLTRSATLQNVVRHSAQGTTIEVSQHATTIQMPCPELPCQSFRFQFDQIQGASIVVTLQVSLASPPQCQGLYLYLPLEHMAVYNPLLWSTGRHGACFTIVKSNPESLVVRFHSSLEFRVCWTQDHLHELGLINLPGECVEPSVTVHLQGFWPTYEQPGRPFRRPEALFRAMVNFGPNNTLRQICLNCLGVCLPLCLAGLMMWLSIASRQPITLLLTVPILYMLFNIACETLCAYYLRRSYVTSELPSWYPYWYHRFHQWKQDVLIRACRLPACYTSPRPKSQSISRSGPQHSATDIPSISKMTWVPRPMQESGKDVDDGVYDILESSARNILHSVEAMLWTTQDWSLPHPAAAPED